METQLTEFKTQRSDIIDILLDKIGLDQIQPDEFKKIVQLIWLSNIWNEYSTEIAQKFFLKVIELPIATQTRLLSELSCTNMLQCAALNQNVQEDFLDELVKKFLDNPDCSSNIFRQLVLPLEQQMFFLGFIISKNYINTLKQDIKTLSQQFNTHAINFLDNNDEKKFIDNIRAVALKLGHNDSRLGLGPTKLCN